MDFMLKANTLLVPPVTFQKYEYLIAKLHTTNCIQNNNNKTYIIRVTVSN